MTLLTVGEIEEENIKLRKECNLENSNFPSWVDTPELIRQNTAIIPYAKEIERLKEYIDKYDWIPCEGYMFLPGIEYLVLTKNGLELLEYRGDNIWECKRSGYRLNNNDILKVKPIQKPTETTRKED